MPRHAVSAFVIAGLVGVIMVSFQNCSGSEVAFSSMPAVSANVARAEEEIGGGLIRVTDQYMLRMENQTMIDMVWVVDNSGSMGTEAAHVRNNVLAFANSVSGVARVKMALISEIGNTGTATFLPAPLLSAGGVEVNQHINSTHSLIALGLSFCPLDMAAECGTALMGNPRVGDAYPGTLGRLVSFFRPGAKKVFVTITDDDSVSTSQNFLGLFRSRYPNELPRVFGFIGLGAESPCQAREGLQYRALTTATAGAVYNICASDWGPHFSRLTESVNTIANLEYELKGTAVVQILSVKINGVTLAASDYTVQNGVLTLTAAAAARYPGGTLEITYTYQQ